MSSFMTWNSSTGIPSPPLALFVVMLPKSHLTSHSRMCALGEWSYHRDYLGHEDLFLYNYSVYYWHLFLISSAFVRSIPFLPFFVPIFSWYVPLVSNFLEEVSSPSHSIVFLYILHWSLRKAFLSLLAILWNSAFRWVYLSISPSFCYLLAFLLLGKWEL